MVAAICALLGSVLVTAALELSVGPADQMADYHVEYRWGEHRRELPKQHLLGETVLMTRHDGLRFLCHIPRLPDDTEDRDGKPADTPSALDLLSPLSQTCIYRVPCSSRAEPRVVADRWLTGCADDHPRM